MNEKDALEKFYACTRNNDLSGALAALKFISIDTLNKQDDDDYDMLIIPGGPEYVVEEKDPSFLAMVRKFFEAGKYVAAICAGPTILGHLGLLKGRRYTCFTSMDEDFGGTYEDRYVVVDGRLITGRSCAASIDFALAIVETLLGKDKADRLKESIYY